MGIKVEATHTCDSCGRGVVSELHILPDWKWHRGEKEQHFFYYCPRCYNNIVAAEYRKYFQTLDKQDKV